MLILDLLDNFHSGLAEKALFPAYPCHASSQPSCGTAKFFRAEFPRRFYLATSREG